METPPTTPPRFPSSRSQQPSVKLIPLTRGMFALVDDIDFERVSQHSWHLHRNPSDLLYARTTIKDSNGKRKKVRMHRFILNATAGRIDHANRNGLDNTRGNLRLATNSQNQGNSSKGFGVGTSAYRGVHWNRRQRAWRACISINNKTVWLGTYRGDTGEVDAARSYDRAAEEHFGEFALLNFPRASPPANLCAVPALSTEPVSLHEISLPAPPSSLARQGARMEIA